MTYNYIYKSHTRLQQTLNYGKKNINVIANGSQQPVNYIAAAPFSSNTTLSFAKHESSRFAV